VDTGKFKVIGILCLVVCVVCVFVAIERYQANAENVRAMSSMNESIIKSWPRGERPPDLRLEPATPTITKYALFFAALAAVGGIVLLAKSGSKGTQESPRPPRSDPTSQPHSDRQV